MENFREKQGPLPSDVGPAAKGIGRVMSSRRFARHFVFFFRRRRDSFFVWATGSPIIRYVKG